MDEMKKWIDNADYETLLKKWRNAPISDPFFQGEVGKYYDQVMREKRSQISDKERVAASKNIGWDH